MAEVIGTALIEIIPDTSSFSGALSSATTEAVDEATGILSDGFSDAEEEVTSALGDAGEAAGDALVDAIESGATEAADELTTTLGDAGEAAGEALAEGVGTGAEDAATDLVSALGDAGDTAGDALADGVSSGFDGLGDEAESVAGDVGDALSDVDISGFEAETEAAADATEAVGSSAEDAAAVATGAFAGVSLGGLIDEIDTTSLAVGGLAIGAGALAEGFARGQADATTAIQRVGEVIGETDDDIRDMIAGLTNITFAFGDAATAAEELVRRGITDLGQIEELLPLMDTFATATGGTATEAVGNLDAILRGVGLTIADAETALDTFTFVLSETPVALSDLERAVGRVPVELQQMNLGLDGAVAALGLLIEQGTRPRDAIRDFGTAAENSGGNLEVFLTELGLTAAEFDAYVERIGNAEGRTDAFATITAEALTPTQQLQQNMENLLGSFGGLGPIIATAAIPLAVGGTLITGMASLVSLAPAVATGLATMTAALGPWGLALAAGAAIVGAFGIAQLTSVSDVDELTNALQAQTITLAEWAEQQALSLLEERGLLETASEHGITLDALNSAILGNRDALEEQLGAAEAAADAEAGHSTAITNTQREVQSLIDVLGGESEALAETAAEAQAKDEAINTLRAGTVDYVDAAGRMEQGLLGVATAAGEATTAIDEEAESALGTGPEIAAGFEAQAVAAENATSAIIDYNDELRALTDPVFAARRAVDNVTTAQDAYNAAVEEFGPTSDEATSAASDLTQAEIDQNTALLNVSSEGAQAFIDQLRQMRDDGLISEETFRALRRQTRGLEDDAQDTAAEIAGELIPALDDAGQDRTATLDITGDENVRTRAEGVARFIQTELVDRNFTAEVDLSVNAREVVFVQEGNTLFPRPGSGVIIGLQAGGLTVDDLFAQLHDDEAVLPLTDSRALGAIAEALAAPIAGALGDLPVGDPAAFLSGGAATQTFVESGDIIIESGAVVVTNPAATVDVEEAVWRVVSRLAETRRRRGIQN